MGSISAEVDIMNMALDVLDEDPILAPTDKRKSARFMLRNYAATRDSLLRAHPWNFASERDALAALTETPKFGWAYMYQLPANCVRLLPITLMGEIDGPLVPHVVEGDKILTNYEAPLPVRYIARITNPLLFDPMFVQALVGSLAHKAANTITGKQSYSERAYQLSKDAMLNAQMIDALEGSPEKADADDWVNGRFVGVT